MVQHFFITPIISEIGSDRCDCSAAGADKETQLLQQKAALVGSKNLCKQVGRILCAGHFR